VVNFFRGLAFFHHPSGKKISRPEKEG